jgi:hypothetical protein
MTTAPPANAQLLDKLILSLDKAFRSYRLYEARGAQYEAHVREMASQAALATEQGAALLTITPHGIQTHTARADDPTELNRTWFDLFEQGARQLIFMPGVGRDEIREMLQIMGGENVGGEDIITILWRREMEHIRVVVARTLVRGTGTNMSTEDALEAQYGHWRNLLSPEASVSDKRVQLSPDDLRVLVIEGEPLLWCEGCVEPPKRDSKEAGFETITGDMEAFLDLLGGEEVSGEECDQILGDLIGSYARLGLTEKINQVMSLAEAHPALGAWSLERMLTAVGGIDALIPLIESSPSAFRDTLMSLAATDTALMEELLSKIEADSVRGEIETLVITQDSAPLAFHSGRLSSASAEEQLESVKYLFDLGTEEATYLALEGSASFHEEVRVYTLTRLAPIYEDPMRTSLMRIFRDKQEAIRIQVYRFVKQEGDRYFLRETLSLAKDGYFSRRSEDEQWEVIQALSAHGRLPVINLFFCGVASSSSIWTNEHVRKIQHEAIRVLTRFPTEDGLHVLKKLGSRFLGAKELRLAARQALAQLEAKSNRPRPSPAGDDA